MFGCALLVPAAAANAQADDDEGRRLSIRPTIQLIYDSNVFKVNPRAALGAGPQTSDVSVSPGLNVDISLPLGRQRVYLSGFAGYDFFLRNSRLDRERIALTGGADLRLVGSCAATTELTYGRSQGDLANGLSLFAIPNTEERVTLRADARCGGPIGLQPGIGYTREKIENSNNAFAVGNSVSDTYRASLAYVRPTFGSLSAFGSYTDARYNDRTTATGAPIFGEGIESYVVGLRFERQIGARLRGSIAGGYNWVNPKLGGRSFRGPNYDASIDYRASERLNLSFAAARRAELPNLLNVQYSITDNFNFRAVYQANPRLDLNMGASYSKRDLRQSSAAVGLPFFADRDELTQLNLGAGYLIGRKLRLNAGFSHQRRRSDNDFFRYNANQVSIGASYEL
jgi:hypothetical protein